MGRRRPDWWVDQQQQQQQQQQNEQLDLLEDGCPRNAANARERARMRVLSKAFSRLKTTLPWVPADTKLSKLDTLRLATTYIAHLSSLLTTSEQSNAADPSATVIPVAVTNSSHPPNYAMTWPYNVQYSGKERSSPEEDDCGYDRYDTPEEQESCPSYGAYYAPSIANP